MEYVVIGFVLVFVPGVLDGRRSTTATHRGLAS